MLEADDAAAGTGGALILLLPPFFSRSPDPTFGIAFVSGALCMKLLVSRIKRVPPRAVTTIVTTVIDILTNCITKRARH